MPPGAKPYFEIPVFNWFAGRLSAIYQRQYIDSAQRFADAPRLTTEQIEALDLLDALANDPALHFTMELRSRATCSSCTTTPCCTTAPASTTGPSRERQRHLLRLWLSPASARPLPPVYAQRYGNVVPGYRGGVPSADGRLRAGLEFGESVPSGS